MTGGPALFIAVQYSFISDISAPEQRAFRMGMVHLAGRLASPIGPPFGVYLYKTGKSPIISIFRAY